MSIRLRAEELRAKCDPSGLGVSSTREIEPLRGIVGQDRGLKALEFGLGINLPGFNIYVAGEEGTGRSAAVNEFLSQVAAHKPSPPDWCYVHNYKDSYVPRAIKVAPGGGQKLARDVASLLSTAELEIPKVFESEEYQRKRDNTLRAFNRKREEIGQSMSERARVRGFILQATPAGLVVLPAKDGRPMTEQEFALLSSDERQRINEQREQVDADLSMMAREMRALERDAMSAIDKLDRDTVLYAIGDTLEGLLAAYRELPDVVQYLNEMRDDILESAAILRAPQRPQDNSTAPNLQARTRESRTRRYSVNVLVDNSETRGAPVVMEMNPTYANLFGRIEKEAHMGVLVTDFTLVRPGSLHRANGGYLVVPAEELVRNPLAYEGLKRALKSREISVDEPGERMGLMVTKTLRPEPVPLDLKVVMIGSPRLYDYLFALDPDFQELFKVKAEFDTSMDRTPESIRTYVSLMSKIVSSDGLLHLDASAMAMVIEHGSRLAADQTKLTTRFADIADVIREASYYATRAGEAEIASAHIAEAISQKTYRSNLIESRFSDHIKRGVLKIDVKGAAVGEINGVSLVGLGSMVFGRPCRISATVGPGRGGIIAIERAVNLSGPFHSKGVLILSGLVTARYAHDTPLGLTARLVFEQSYSVVDGDSASLAELYALLSAISRLPLRRSIAVTGSLNQAGEVQAVGGVNEKIEGFFEVCKNEGLDGEHGVIIPRANVTNLMLNDEVLGACRGGKFHVYAVSTIDEGIELLTGVPAGERGPDGEFLPETVNRIVRDRLRELAQHTYQFTGRCT